MTPAAPRSAAADAGGGAGGAAAGRADNGAHGRPAHAGPADGVIADDAPGDERAAPSRGIRQSVAALRHRNFARFWTGALVSNCGTWMQNVTVPYVVYQQTRSASLVGLTGFCQFIPAMFLGPVGGWAADHYPRRNVLLVTQSAMAVL